MKRRTKEVIILFCEALAIIAMMWLLGWTSELVWQAHLNNLLIRG